MDKKYGKSDQTFLRSYNRNKVRCILRDKGPKSRVELSDLSNLDKKTITNIINEMSFENEIKAIAKERSGPGRPKEILSLDGSFKNVVGLDIGAMHFTGVILDFTGELLSRYSLDLTSMTPDLLPSICNMVLEELLKKAGLLMDDISEIGVAFPGHINSKTGKTILSENMSGWKSVPLEKLLTAKYAKNVTVDDCSRLMALAELRYGAGKDRDNIITFDLGYGIGSGLIISRKVYSGTKGLSGEFGHTIVEVDGPLCTCGRKGCIESLASGWALSELAIEMLNKNQSPILYKSTRENTIRPTIKEISIAAKLGDKKCIELLKKAGRYIAIGIINMINIIDPGKVIIGGRLVNDNDIMLNEIIRTIKRESIPELLNNLEIVPSSLGETVSAVGAATMCLEKYFSVNNFSNSN